MEVCERRCEFDKTSSTSTSSKCFLPDVSTTYSNLNYKIAEPSDDLKGKPFGTYSNNEAAFDDILTNNPGTT